MQKRPMKSCEEILVLPSLKSPTTLDGQLYTRPVSMEVWSVFVWYWIAASHLATCLESKQAIGTLPRFTRLYWRDILTLSSWLWRSFPEKIESGKILYITQDPCYRGGSEGALVTHFNCRRVRTKIVGIPTYLSKKNENIGGSVGGRHLEHTWFGVKYRWYHPENIKREFSPFGSSLHFCAKMKLHFFFLLAPISHRIIKISEFLPK